MLRRFALQGFKTEDSSANVRANGQPRLEIQCAICNSGKCSVDLEGPIGG